MERSQTGTGCYAGIKGTFEQVETARVLDVVSMITRSRETFEFAFMKAKQGPSDGFAGPAKATHTLMMESIWRGNPKKLQFILITIKNH